MKFGIMAALISLFSITTLADEGIKFEMGAQFPKTISIVGYDANEKIAFDANGKVRFYLQRETTTVYKIYFNGSETS